MQIEKSYSMTDGALDALEDIKEEDESNEETSFVDEETKTAMELVTAEKLQQEAIAAAERQKKRLEEVLAKCKAESASTDATTLVSELCDSMENCCIQVDRANTKVDELSTKLRDFKLRRDKHIKSLILKFDNATNVDLAFVMDATGSMASYIEEVKKTIGEIVDTLKKTYKSLKIRLAFVAYRDLCDGDKRLQVLDFVDSIDTFRRYVGEVKAQGGGDAPEDIAIGISAANGLDWQHTTRVVVVIGDQPCHGTEFHDHGNKGDSHPAGTPGICIVNRFRELASTSVEDGSMNIFFGKITKHTDKMLDRLVYNYDIPITAADFTSKSKLGRTMVDLILSSIFNTVTATGTRAETIRYNESRRSVLGQVKPKKFKIHTKPILPKDTLGATVRQVTVYRNQRIVSIGCLQSPLQVGRLTNEGETVASSHMLIQRFHQPFAQGGSRIAYHGRMARKRTDLKEPRNRVVLKTFKRHGPGVNTRNEYFKKMEVSSIASFLAELYNNSAFRPPSCTRVFVLPNAVVEVDGEEEEDGNRYYFAEPVLMESGTEFVKYNNNLGFWNEAHLDESLVRFTHFTYTITRGYMVVGDLQGVKVGGVYYLTDPAVLCSDFRRFDANNLGPTSLMHQVRSAQRIASEMGWDLSAAS